MKTFVKITGIFSLLLATLSFYLMLANPAVTFMPKSVWESGSDRYLASQFVIFGGLGVGPTFAGLTSFLLMIISLLLVGAGIILPLIKNNDFSKLSSILNFSAVILLFIAGLLILNIVPSYINAAGDNSFCADNLENGYYTIGIYWIFSGVLSIVASLFNIIPAVCDLTIK
ncbi:MAG: hypothetical protein J6X03_00050 [Bacilli bacterium]|nr:hypothetical protein [Bacilli bacterium]